MSFNISKEQGNVRCWQKTLRNPEQQIACLGCISTWDIFFVLIKVLENGEAKKIIEIILVLNHLLYSVKETYFPTKSNPSYTSYSSRTLLYLLSTAIDTSNVYPSGTEIV